MYKSAFALLLVVILLVTVALSEAQLESTNTVLGMVPPPGTAPVVGVEPQIRSVTHSLALADGALDPNFGLNGKATIANAGQANDVAIQRSGALVAVGETVNFNGDRDFVLVRYESDGSLDTTFGNGGVVQTDFYGEDDTAYALALQDDGKIVVAGVTDRIPDAGTNSDFVIARYDSDGRLDTTFGDGDGVVTFDLGGNSEAARSVQIQGDNRIVVAGLQNCYPCGFVLRFTNDGSLDTSFGEGTGIAETHSPIIDIAIQADTKILLLNTAFGVYRFTNNGNPDMYFGENGYASVSVSGAPRSKSITVQNDGKIVIGGYTNLGNPNTDFAVARLLINGSLDTNFGNGIGFVTYDVAGQNDHGNSIVTQADGKIILAGMAQRYSNAEDFAAIRYNVDGSRDTTFGSDGVVLTDFNMFGDRAHAMLLQADGKIVLAGHSDNYIAIVRYVNATPDTLSAIPTSIPGQVKLTWTAPADENGNAVAGYDIRFSSSPITEANWGNATQLTGEPVPSAPGSSESMTVSRQSGTRWYFAMKYTDALGSTSDLSRTRSLLDLGFRSDWDGYYFDNYSDVDPDDYTIDDMRRMFGDDNVCLFGSDCIVNPLAHLYHLIFEQVAKGGHCDGMASTSLRFFEGLDNPASYGSGDGSTFDIPRAAARRHIAYFHTLQLTEPVKRYKEQIRQDFPSTILNQLYTAMSGSSSDPTTLFVRQAGVGGHALSPFAISDMGNGEHRVYVYDSNYPGENANYVTVNVNSDSWYYDLGYKFTNDRYFFGDESTDSLGIVPISQYAEDPECPWCINATILSPDSVADGEVWLVGGGHLLITNSTGQRIGYADEVFVDEIQSAYATMIDAGLGIEQEPIYTLPLTDTYEILLDGRSLTQTLPATITHFGPNHGFSISNQLVQTSQDEILFTPDGTRLLFSSSDGSEPELTMISNDASRSYHVEIEGADVAAGETVLLEMDTTAEHLVFSHDEAGDSSYNVQVIVTDSGGQSTFVHEDVDINAGETHYFDLGSWDGEGGLTLCRDYESDDAIDECSSLENQNGWFVFLPVTVR